TILLADEPTGNLDPDLSLEILKLFLDFHDHGTTVLIATHDMNLLRVAKKRVLQLDHGELILDTGARA
ncbi:MAG: cell division ATP-binding protein FtsE, partial [Pseudomonadota bacterium]